jgi:hypothetical protein
MSSRPRSFDGHAFDDDAFDCEFFEKLTTNAASWSATPLAQAAWTKATIPSGAWTAVDNDGV